MNLSHVKVLSVLGGGIKTQKKLVKTFYLCYTIAYKRTEKF